MKKINIVLAIIAVTLIISAHIAGASSKPSGIYSDSHAADCGSFFKNKKK